MPFETQVVIGAIILVFAFFMVLVAWAERRAGGSFDDELHATGPTPDELAGGRDASADSAEERRAA